MPDMTLSQALGVMRTQFDTAMARGIPTPIKALEPRDIVPGVTECYGTIGRLPRQTASGGNRLRVQLECYYAIHYATDGATAQPIDDLVKLLWVMQDVQKPTSVLWDTAQDKAMLVVFPDGSASSSCEIFFNPVVRNGGVVTLAVNFVIEMFAPHP
jgi:hypothetical protein